MFLTCLPLAGASLPRGPSGGRRRRTLGRGSASRAVSSGRSRAHCVDGRTGPCDGSTRPPPRGPVLGDLVDVGLPGRTRSYDHAAPRERKPLAVLRAVRHPTPHKDLTPETSDDVPFTPSGPDPRPVGGGGSRTRLRTSLPDPSLPGKGFLWVFLLLFA